MRTIVIFCGNFLILLLGSAPLCSADAIHLKNGRTIWADQVRESSTRVEYDVGDDTYAIPKASVERIEAGGIPPQNYRTTESKSQRELPPLALPDNVKDEPGLSGRVIQDGRVDSEELASIDQQGSSAARAEAYFIAGKFEFGRGDFSKSRSYFERALRFDAQNPAILNYYAALLVRTGAASEALSYAEKAVRAAPDSPDALDVLGYAQFASDHAREAIVTWKRSLAIRPDGAVRHYLEKAEREASAEADYSQRESSHFTLRYEGRQTSESFRSQLVATLESEYDDLVRQLGIAPRDNIVVILYTGQVFFDVTQAPSWSGAVNDGKLRIPVQGMDSVSREMARVLKHELAHSFINQLSSGRCPQWLNEGIAQAVEPKLLTSGHRLSVLYQSQHEIPFNALEGSFMHFQPGEAAIAYDESLAAVQYISDTYGMSDVQRILARLSQGNSAEAALRTTIHSDYGQLEEEVRKYLLSKYGG